MRHQLAAGRRLIKARAAQGSCRRDLLRHLSRASRCSTWTIAEDSTAETDANFVLTGAGDLVEIQGTAEGAVQPRRVREPVQPGEAGIGELIELQKAGARPMSASAA